MKNLIMKSTMLMGAALLMGIGANAQSLKVSIPFPFEANGKSLPAGDYNIRMTSVNGGGVYAMRNMGNHDGVLLMGTHSITNSRYETKLVFAQAVDGYYLQEVWDGSGARAVRSPHGRSSIVAATRVVLASSK